MCNKYFLSVKETSKLDYITLHYMIYLLSMGCAPLVWRTGLTLTLISRTRWGVEEVEHWVLRLVGVLIIWLVLPLLEGGITFWVIQALIVISRLLWARRPLFVYALLEGALVPIVTLILGWGVQPERITAVYYLINYTLCLSCPLLIRVLLWEKEANRLRRYFLRALIGVAFIAKLPLYLIHIWLPKAHVEAPTTGSVLLAGILLKTGRVGLMWTQNYCGCRWRILLLICGLLGRGLVAVVCRLQADIKSLVAYRRVVHINYSIVVITLVRVPSDRGRSVLILRHSFVSRLILRAAGACFHSLNTRIIYFLQESFLLKERAFLVLGCLCLRNFSIPPSVGLLGEVSSLVRGLTRVWGVRGALLIYLFLVAYYSLFLRLALVSTKGRVSLNRTILTSYFVISLTLLRLCLLSFY